ncbi:hypothetical protein SAMN05216410_0480 [Sanguibacter gelidistatuariae]|uniref:Uncharacterized protein n=1 Tax=Sanguibacter gelidistatuariae TaxID=1814289 RepID=A0A1G6GUA4_9MICO|nr:hypothetical protein [Sanguibacter gelidistatuariae]SDB85587.1 hypothetical protein SAMN05216410_0480 [Sanguibacter gelidistatuariae]
MAAVASTFPYLTIPNEAVIFERWVVSCGSALPSVDPEALPDWSYHQVLNIGATVTIPYDQVRLHLRLANDAQLGATIAWQCLATQSRGASIPVPIMADTTATRLTLDGAPLGGILTLSLHLVLLNPGSGPIDPLSPTLPGAILWTTKHSILLEGDAARFPTAKADFSALDNGFPNAHWWLELHIDEDALDAPSDSAMRLWLNENSVIAKSILDDDSAGGALVKIMTSDVYRQLIRAAFDIDTFSMEIDYGIGSIGHTLQMLLHMLDYSDINLARSAHREDPTRLDARLQSVVNK